MKSNFFKTVTLGEISIDKKGSYGIAASAVDYSEELPTYIRITDISDDGFLIKDELKSVDDPRSERYVLEPNDIVFARTGNSTGKSYFYDGTDGELVYAGFLIKFSLDSDKVNPRYIRYYTLSHEYLGWVKSFSTGSTRANINANMYKNMEIELPNRNYQDFVVSLLSSFENKVKHNEEIIKNLEELAQTLFKQWFVDFEFPNKKSEPYKSSGGKMIESELGMVPEGWIIGTLNDIGDIVAGGTPSRKVTEYFVEEGFSWITPKDLSIDNSVFKYKGAIDITKEALEKSSAKLHPKNTVLFSSRAPIGYVAIAGQAVSTNQGFKSIIPNDNFSSEYIYLLLKYLIPVIESYAGGSTFKEISGKGMKLIKTIIPKKKILNEFYLVVHTLFDVIKVRENENKSLIELRDTLLPKLLSGEIELPDTQEVTDDVPIS